MADDVSYDAVIIGAGPAGSMAAWEFSRAGWKALLIDKARFPRDKACGGALSSRALRALPFDISPVVEKRISWHTANNLSRSDVFAATPVMQSIIISRRRFDAFLLDRALACGAMLSVGDRVVRLSLDGSVVRIFTLSREYRAHAVVLACGAGIGLDQDGLLKVSDSPSAFALEACLSVPDTARLQSVMDFDFRFPDAGYSWVFPTASSFNVGLATFSFSAVHLSKRILLDHFHVMADALGGSLSAIRGAPLGIGGLDYHPRGLALYAGDAAGLTSESTGEGISSAIISGRLCARAFIESVRTRVPAADIYMDSLAPMRKWLLRQRERGAALYGL